MARPPRRRETNRRRLGVGAVVGAAVVVFGLAAVVARDLAGVVPLTETFVLLVGGLALLQGARYALGARYEQLVTVETGDPERRQSVPTPGDDFDSTLRGAITRRRGAVTQQRAVRTRLRNAAVETLVARGDADAETAAAAVEDGTWTADPVAAAFLGQSTSLPVGFRLRAYLSRRSAFQLGVERTVDELLRLQGGER
ncbi:DUF7269 family protein [Haloferacaceae archaeon DSL9]